MLYTNPIQPNTINTDSPLFAALTNLGYGSQQMQAIARPSSPVAGIAGFLFSIDETCTAQLRTVITDHYLGDNTAVQDHAVTSPIRIVCKGKVGEMVIGGSSPGVAFNINPAQYPINSNFAPAGTINFVNTTAIQKLQPSLYATYLNMAGVVKPGFNQNSSFGFFFQTQLANMVFSVETPWGMFTNMMIEEFTATQDKDTRSVTGYDVVFKQIRFASSPVIVQGQLLSVLKPNPPSYATGTAVQVGNSFVGGGGRFGGAGAGGSY